MTSFAVVTMVTGNGMTSWLTQLPGPGPREAFIKRGPYIHAYIHTYIRAHLLTSFPLSDLKIHAQSYAIHVTKLIAARIVFFSLNKIAVFLTVPNVHFSHKQWTSLLVTSIISMRTHSYMYNVNIHYMYNNIIYICNIYL